MSSLPRLFNEIGPKLAFEGIPDLLKMGKFSSGGGRSQWKLQNGIAVRSVPVGHE